MHLAITVIIGILNILLLVAGARNAFPAFWVRPGVETATALLISTVPFAATALYAAGFRGRPLWSLAAILNLLGIVAMLGFAFFARGVAASSADGAALSGFAIAGAISTLNAAYLLWRMPPKLPRRATPVPHTSSSEAE